MPDRTTNDTLAVIRRRRSVRSYTAIQITDEELDTIVEAGRYAPSAGGQAWHFTVVQNKKLLAELNAAAKAVAKHAGGLMAALATNETYDCLHGAPTLIVVSGDEQSPSPQVDCAAATENMLIAAESLGLGACWLFFITLAFGSPRAAELRQALEIPGGYRPYAAAVFGCKRGDAADAPPRKANVVSYIR